jgi:hypothetical protein
MERVKKQTIQLNKDTTRIKEFITKAIYNFEKQHGNPKSIGVYSCPWAGWITMNFNLTKKLEEADWNCPDFEFVEYSFIDFREWNEKYEMSINSSLIIQFDKIHSINPETQGDETLNQIFFQYLKRVVRGIDFNKNYKIVLQMLDSNCVETIEM